MVWTDICDASHRATILDLRQYLSPLAMGRLGRLNHELFQRYRVKAVPPRYTKKRGWVFPYQLQGVTLFSLTVLDETGFAVDELVVNDDSSLEAAFMELEQRCRTGFLQKAEAAKESAKRKREERRPMLRPAAIAAPELPPGSDPKKLDRFSWTPALPPDKLRRLYRSSAKGMLDHDLLEDVGCLLYLRCRQGVEEFTLIRSGRLKCHHCGAILLKGEGLMLCGCGYQYTFQEYDNSFKEHHMPGGNAAHIFSEFVEKWPAAQTDVQKMNLIDWMVHQCHIIMSSGMALRSVLKNLIDASPQTAKKLILELAYEGGI